MALRPDIRWCSKVAEMKGMGTPGSGQFISEKNLVGKYFFELDFVGDPSISLIYKGNSPYKIKGISPKIKQHRRVTNKIELEKIFSDEIFFEKIFFSIRPNHTVIFRYFRAPTDQTGKYGPHSRAKTPRNCQWP